jgi:hypothetical protein
MEVQPLDLYVFVAAVVRITTRRKQEQDQRQQQQHSARRGQLFQDRPEERLHDLPGSA